MTDDTRHHLSDIDAESQRGTCSRCGPTRLYKNGAQRISSWVCATRKRDECPRVRVGERNPLERTIKRCPGCEETKPLGQFSRAGNRADGHQSVCKACELMYRRSTQRPSDLKRKFGLTVEAFNAMIEAQDLGCAICRRPDAGGKGNFHIDHDHACCPGDKSCGNCIRGVLCSRCNTGLGMFLDSPDILALAIGYLTKVR